MSYMPFVLMNAVILAMVAHVFMRALADGREHAKSRRAVAARADIAGNREQVSV